MLIKRINFNRRHLLKHYIHIHELLFLKADKELTKSSLLFFEIQTDLKACSGTSLKDKVALSETEAPRKTPTDGGDADNTL